MASSFRWIPAVLWAAASNSVTAQEPACIEISPGPMISEVFLMGAVQEPNLGAGLPGAEVSVAAKEGRDGWRDVTSVTTTVEGTFELCLRLAASVDSLRLAPHAMGLSGEPLRLSIAEAVALRTTDELWLEVDLQAGAAEAGSEAVAVQSVAASGMSVRGRVTDIGGGEPVSGATVHLLRRGGSVVTSADGTFLIPVMSQGADTVVIQHLGYGTARALVEPSPGATVTVEARLSPDPVELEPIVVTAVQYHRLEIGGFYDRMERGRLLGIGVYLTEEEIREQHTNRVSNIVSRVPSVQLLRICGGHCVVLPQMTGAADRWAGSADTGYYRTACPADVYLNGSHLNLFYYDSDGGLIVRDGIDDFVLPAEVTGIEIYRRAGELPANFGGARDGCGAVVIWTR